MQHSEGGYHCKSVPLEKEFVVQWFSKQKLIPPIDYLHFLSEIGPGIFFGGLLIVHPLESPIVKSVESETKQLARLSSSNMFVFGYDGTTEGCYCLHSSEKAENVSWFSWEDSTERSLSPSFNKWIEAKPKELFRTHSYAAYKNIANLEGVKLVMDERAKFNVRLLSFENQLVKSPDRPKDLLPRFNKVILEITKIKQSQLAVLTVRMMRLDSKVGKDNIEYLTVPVSDIPVGSTVRREYYLFDPFNQPFTNIKLEFNPLIDLSSKMRVRFQEIKDLL
ncbi:MAG: hypothetical protein JWR19_4100 [Pedosphaera sp.]|nr:hypothetical protein [Pedosphaera sp.]